MVKYDIIINTILIILILTIIIVVLFGCHFKGCKYFENFENNEKKESKEGKTSDLNKFEQSVLEGLSSGSLNTEKLANLIKEEKFTPMNLDNIINHVEKFKGSI
jgi:hypothetical protein